MATGDHVLALRIEDEVHIRSVLAGRRIPCEAHARSRCDSRVPEDHGLDGHRRTCQVRYALQFPVVHGTRSVPRSKHGSHRTEELLLRFLGKWSTDGRPIEVQFLVYHLPQGGNIELVDRGHSMLGHHLLRHPRERGRRAAIDHLGKGLDQTTIGVPHEHRVPGGAEQSGQCGIREPYVQHSLEHPRHGDGSARAYRHARSGRRRDRNAARSARSISSIPREHIANERIIERVLLQKIVGMTAYRARMLGASRGRPRSSS